MFMRPGRLEPAGQHLNICGLDLGDAIGSAQDSAGPALVELHHFNSAVDLEVVAAAVEGQPLAYQCHLPLCAATCQPERRLHSELL